MTRVERAQKRVEDDKKALEDSRRVLAQAEAKERAKDRKATDKRRYRMGAEMDEAGLFVLDDTTLMQLIGLLAPLVALPDPVGTLDSLIGVPLILAEQGRVVLPGTPVVVSSGGAC